MSVRDWYAGPAAAVIANQETLNLAFRMEAKRSREAVAMERAATEESLVADIRAGLLVFRTRDNVPISDDQIEERSRNLACGLLGGFRIERLP